MKAVNSLFFIKIVKILWKKLKQNRSIEHIAQ